MYDSYLAEQEAMGDLWYEMTVEIACNTYKYIIKIIKEKHGFKEFDVLDEKEQTSVDISYEEVIQHLLESNSLFPKAEEIKKVKLKTKQRKEKNKEKIFKLFKRNR